MHAVRRLVTSRAEGGARNRVVNFCFGIAVNASLSTPFVTKRHVCHCLDQTEFARRTWLVPTTGFELAPVELSSFCLLRCKNAGVNEEVHVGNFQILILSPAP